MGIRFYCPNGHRLHVKTFQAGKRGICPHCDARFRIPHESEIPKGAPKLRSSDPAGASTSLPSDPAPSVAEPDRQSESTPAAQIGTSDLLTESPTSVWYVRPPSGGQYGPAQSDVMQRWLAEGRVSSDTLVWREGWPEWRLAGPLFPNLPAETAESEIATEPEPARAARPDIVIRQDEAQRVGSRATRRASRTSSVKSIGLIVGLVTIALALVVALVLVLYYRR